MLTYQDLMSIGETERERGEFLLKAIREHQSSAEYQTALDAEEYARRRNVTISRYRKTLMTLSGKKVPDNYSANHKVGSAFFQRFVNQLNQYLLGNGAKMDSKDKEKLGRNFDIKLQKLGRDALVQGVSFGFWNHDKLESYKLTEFVPLMDEETGALRAGIYFWKLADKKPLRIVLFEEDGFSEFIKRPDEDIKLKLDKKAYKETVHSTAAGEQLLTVGENYSALPIIPLWGNPEKQSELVGLQEAIDCYDLIKSGFANDMDDAAVIYWLIKNAGGMTDEDLVQFRHRMKTVGAASVDGEAGESAEAHTVEIPYEARSAYLKILKEDLYEDAQVTDVRQLTSGDKTATEIDAAYDPMNTKVDNYEYCVLEFLEQLFSLVGIEASVSFERSRVVNELERTQMVLLAAQYLDDELILRKLPWITQEEVDDLMDRKAQQASERFAEMLPEDEPIEE